MLMVKTLCPPKLALDKQNITSESFDYFFQNQHRSLSFSLSLYKWYYSMSYWWLHLLCDDKGQDDYNTQCNSSTLVTGSFSLWLITSPHKGS